MQKLKLQDERMMKVLNGDKLQTIREGIRDITLGDLILESTNGTVEDILCDVYGIVYTSLGNVDLKDTPDYQSKEDLFETMTKIYPSIKPESKVTIIKFKVKD